MPFTILTEGSVGAGARRIEAVTSGEAYALLHGARHEAEDLRRELEAVRKEARKPKAQAAADFTIVERESDVVLVEAKGAKGGELRDLSDRLRQQEKAAGVIVGSVDDGRAYLVVNLDESLVGKGLDASQLVRTSDAISAAAEAGGRRSPRPVGRTPLAFVTHSRRASRRSQRL